MVQDSFTKGRCCLTRLVASYGGVATPVDTGEAADAVCRGFRKASDRVGLIMLLPNNTKDIRLLVCVRGRATEVAKGLEGKTWKRLSLERRRRVTRPRSALPAGRAGADSGQRRDGGRGRGRSCAAGRPSRDGQGRGLGELTGPFRLQIFCDPRKSRLKKI